MKPPVRTLQGMASHGRAPRTVTRSQARVSSTSTSCASRKPLLDLGLVRSSRRSPLPASRNRQGLRATGADGGPYGPLAWQHEVQNVDPDSPGPRSLLIGMGASHVIETLGLRDVVVVDTSTQGSLKLPFPEAGTLGNEPGLRLWKGDFLSVPYYFAPMDQIVMCSCFESEWATSQAFQDERPGEIVGRVEEEFVANWLNKCVDLLRPGGIVVFQELVLGDNSKSEKILNEIRGIVQEKLPLEVVHSSPSSLCLRLPQSYLFKESPLRLKSKVVHGFQRGSKQLGFPTANLEVSAIEDQIAGLKKGVYFGWAKVNYKDKGRAGSLGKAPKKVVANVGQRPSFEDGTDITIEVHVMDCLEDDFYGEEMRVVLLGFIRPEKKFDGIQELVSQIKRDCGMASKQLDEGVHKAFSVDAFVNGRNASYSFKVGVALSFLLCSDPLPHSFVFRVQRRLK
uniref:riboflavin kinase n=1 Tax=Chloropicon primus TaxID=1764295 RepID=A0A7S2SXM0_9CHLO|mmetsp:Transcript_12021/g.33263  ORF Transcript_12021/g.33263 Transcript_12021/m.33263 type:complete len:453 (+) Transcript_12021:193-1551(+)